MLKSLILLFLTSISVHCRPYDVIVYSATPAGIAGAIAARTSGAERVLLIEPTGYVGGMASPGGIGFRDCTFDIIRINNSTQYYWAMKNAAYYGTDKPVWQPDNWVGEMSFKQMLSEYDVELRLNTNFKEGSEGIRSVVENQLRRITEIVLESGEILQGKYFIDASYEGELMMATGHVRYTYGRESWQQYNESFAGVTSSSLSQFNVSVNPFKHNPFKENTFDLLKYVRMGPDPRSIIGEADDNLMAYSFRACITNNVENSVPFPKPPNYNPEDFELSRRLNLDDIANNRTIRLPWIPYDYSNYPSDIVKAQKYDACCGSAPIGIDAVGLAVGYATANRTQRKQYYDDHKYYVQGLMWFWSTDPSVPDDIRNKIKTYGLCKDEWPKNGHFPPQLYVREAVRMVGDKVFSQANRSEADKLGGCLDDSIAIGDWGFDIHDMQRVVVFDQQTKEPFVFNEGLTDAGTGGMYPYEIPYYVVLPQRSEMVNLAVPNCPSVSHVTFAAIRVEPTLWQLGQASGTAAGFALKIGDNLPLHDVPVINIQESLIEQGTFVHWPPKDTC